MTCRTERLSRQLCQMCREDCGPPCNTTCTQDLLNFPAINASMTAMMGDMTDPGEVGMNDVMDHLQELEDLEPRCGARTLHWRLAGRRVMLEYEGGDQRMALGFSDESLDDLMEDPDFTEDCPEFMSKMADCGKMEEVAAQFPSMMSDMMSDMVPDCHAMVSSFNCTDDMELTPTGDTMMDMGENWAIKTYPCSLEYTPVVRRGFWQWVIVKGRPLRMRVRIRFS
ncbi:Hypp1762 [Branchiostoma lanceolatum]|uniref:Hypp1762 protein n=1 Tax=Branchiostoma lanceolatum TaxID=7740 RepID=A0A8K0EM29_BRALA|nr:Hypp1762 [Branchiostoma lanceolatum]